MYYAVRHRETGEYIGRGFTGWMKRMAYGMEPVPQWRLNHIMRHPSNALWTDDIGYARLYRARRGALMSCGLYTRFDEPVRWIRAFWWDRNENNERRPIYHKYVLPDFLEIVEVRMRPL